MSMYDKNHYNKQKKKEKKKKYKHLGKKKKKNSGIFYPERIIASTPDNFQSFL